MTLSNLVSDGAPHIGNKSAPVILIDFSDFQCYLCKRYVDNTEQQIIDSYVQSGKLTYVFKHLPNRGLDSMNASLAAQCANDQGQFWNYHKILYENQAPIDSGWVSIDKLKAFASRLSGVNQDVFDGCLNSHKHESLVKSNIHFANSMGFTETPSFLLINNNDHSIQKIEGPKPFPIFKVYIEKMLSDSNNFDK